MAVEAGLDAKQIQELDKQHVLHSWSVQNQIQPLPVAGGEGRSRLSVCRGAIVRRHHRDVNECLSVPRTPIHMDADAADAFEAAIQMGAERRAGRGSGAIG